MCFSFRVSTIFSIFLLRLQWIRRKIIFNSIFDYNKGRCLFFNAHELKSIVHRHTQSVLFCLFFSSFFLKLLNSALFGYISVFIVVRRRWYFFSYFLSLYRLCIIIESKGRKKDEKFEGKKKEEKKNWFKWQIELISLFCLLFALEFLKCVNMYNVHELSKAEVERSVSTHFYVSCNAVHIA